MCLIIGEVEETEMRNLVWDGEMHTNSKTREMTYLRNESEEEEEEENPTINQVLSSPSSKEISVIDSKSDETRIITCPSCGHSIELQDEEGVPDLPGLPAGMKFDPSDQEILEHLEAKLSSNTQNAHPLIDEFIPTLEGENGICYTHPEKLPGVSKDGLNRHFFHRPSKAYTTGTRKRRKVHTDTEGGETRWHKTGKTRPILVGGTVKGFKKILVLYTNYGRQRKPEKTNWVMHQYHLGDNEDEKDGEFVASKVFYQTQPRQCASSLKDSLNNNNAHILENTASYVGFYNPPLISYDIGSQNNESLPQLIPNMVLQGEGSSFIHLPTNESKGKVLERK